MWEADKSESTFQFTLSLADPNPTGWELKGKSLHAWCGLYFQINLMGGSFDNSTETSALGTGRQLGRWGFTPTVLCILRQVMGPSWVSVSSCPNRVCPLRDGKSQQKCKLCSVKWNVLFARMTRVGTASAVVTGMCLAVPAVLLCTLCPPLI